MLIWELNEQPFLIFLKIDVQISQLLAVQHHEVTSRYPTDLHYVLQSFVVAFLYFSAMALKS
jgi:hypothetical protein